MNPHASTSSTVLRPPHVQKGNYPREPVPITVVRVWESNTPEGVKPLEWLLLTNRPTTTPARPARLANPLEGLDEIPTHPPIPTVNPKDMTERQT